MARPRKSGMGYFPLDCQMNDKVEMIEAVHGLNGFAVYIKLLQEAYQNDSGKLDMSGVFRWKTLCKKYGIPEENLREIVRDALEIGLFDKNEYETNHCLTSSGIQKRIGRVTALRNKDRNRKSEADMSVDSGFPAENSGKMPQKEKEKEKEIDNTIPGSDEPLPALPEPKPPKPVKPPAYPDDFEAFWKTSDKPTASKKAAYLEWMKLTPADRQTATDNLTVYKAYQPEARYRQDPERYLKKRTYENDFAAGLQQQATKSAQPPPVQPFKSTAPVGRLIE